MPKISSDEIYAKFLAEAKEENGNFYFVKKYDEDLYEKLCEVDRNARINLGDSGSQLRNVLEIFMRRAMPDKYYPEVLDENAYRRGRDYSNTADTIDYQRIFGDHPEIGVDENLFNSVRVVCNSFHHEKGGRNSKMPQRTYRTLCSALRDMQTMLLNYYKKQDPSKLNGLTLRTYDKDRQPYGDKMVCSVMQTLDSTACEQQVLCSRQDERLPDLRHYYLLRVYRADNVSEGAIRDEKVLSSLWGNSLQGMPNIVRYSPLSTTYNGEDAANEKKYIVSYDFGTFKPCPLHSRLIEHLTDKQKLMIMHDIAAGVQVLHHAGIYHRNLQPNSVFVFFDRKSDFVQAKLVGFEYAKISGDTATVLVNVAKLQREDPSAFFSMSMKQGLKNRQVASRLDWAKEDVYSVGALFSFILTGKQPQGSFNPSSLGNAADDELKQLMTKMLSLNINARPDIDEVCAVLDAKYRALV